MLPIAKSSSSGEPWWTLPRFRERSSEILDRLAHSSLAEIPQPLLTGEQILAVLRGENPQPTSAQRAGALRIAGDRS